MKNKINEITNPYHNNRIKALNTHFGNQFTGDLMKTISSKVNYRNTTLTLISFWRFY